MIVGKGSIWKMLALFGLVLLAVLNVISVVNVVKAAYSDVPLDYYWSGVLVSIDCVIIIVVLGMLVYDLYTKWSANYENKKKA